MSSVIRSTWPLLLGIMLLMVGNGMQGTLLGLRGSVEGFSTGQMSVVMAAYFGGFLLGGRIVPGLIRNVGHVRVFAALGAMISAVLILYAAWPNWIFWTALRLMIGFCFSGCYITAESWLNAGTSNEARGRALSAYMIVQMLGIIGAQALMNVASPEGYLLFIIPSVLVSLAFTPILLSATPAPVFGELKPMSIRSLFRVSPLGCVGIFLMGGVFSALFGMSSVWGAEVGLSVRELSAFIAAIYIGGLVLQYPLGWLSDQIDRRWLVLVMSVVGLVNVVATVALQPGSWGLLLSAAIMGGVANPVYAILLAYTNDQLDSRDMAAGSAGLLFINGIGSIAGPLITGWLMGVVGTDGYWIYMGVLLAMLALYGGWRIMRRSGSPASAGGFAVISPTAQRMAVNAALEHAMDDGQGGKDVAKKGAAP